MRKIAILALFTGCLLFTVSAWASNRPIKKKVSAIYPELAKRMHVSGVVKLEVSIEPSGNVGSVKVLSGHPLLGAAATDAVKNWVFEPASEASVEEVAVDFSQ
jgi:TonB family protein